MLIFVNNKINALIVFYLSRVYKGRLKYLKFEDGAVNVKEIPPFVRNGHDLKRLILMQYFSREFVPHSTIYGNA